MPLSQQGETDLDMGTYIRFYPDTWVDDLKRLDNSESCLVAVYLKTNRYAGMIGAYYLPFVTIAHEAKMDIKRVKRAMDEIIKKGLAFYDPQTEEVYVPSYARHNIGDMLKASDSRLKPVTLAYNELKTPWLADKFWNDYGADYGLMKRTDSGAPPPPKQTGVPDLRCVPSPSQEPVPSTKDEIGKLLQRYTHEQQEMIMTAWEMIALTRTRGKVSDTILLVELRRWEKIEKNRVMFSVTRYVDREFYKEGKGERYLYGIMRNTAQAEVEKFENGEWGSRQKPRQVSSVTEHNIAVLKQLREEEGYGMPMDTQ